MHQIRKNGYQEGAVPQFWRARHTILGFCLILLALLGLTVSVQAETIQVEADPGDVATNPRGFAFQFGGGALYDTMDVRFSDEKQLFFPDDPEKASFVLSANIGNAPAFSGFFTDQNGQPIPGTEFQGVFDIDAVEVPVGEGTFPPGISWSGIVFQDVQGTGFGTAPDSGEGAPLYILVWISRPTVVQGQPNGNLLPIADAGGPYEVGIAGVDFAFDGSGSGDPDGTIVEYRWEFGDGQSGSGEKPMHTYEVEGTYNVILTVTDNDGLTNSRSTTAEVRATNQRPEADVGGPYSGTKGLRTCFDGWGSSDPDDDIARYDWDYGDGSSAEDAGEMPTHVYAEDGSYTVKLTVKDSSGEFDTDTAEVTIGIGNLAPQADAGDPVSERVGRDITFDGTGSSDPDGDIKSYAWEFGDGNSGTGPNPTHSYADADTYIVTLTVTDSDGAKNSDLTLAFIESRRQCVDECKADKDECLEVARADREECFEKCEDRSCKRDCRSDFRDARDDCRAEFSDCRADCR
jgi:PKD repeat protein